MRNEQIDFIATDYAVGDRRARGDDPAARPGAEDRRRWRTSRSTAAASSSARAARPFRSGPPSSTPRRGRSSSSSTSSATRPSRWPEPGRPRRRTCSRTSAAASAACRTRRRGSAWRQLVDALPRHRRRRRTAASAGHRGLRVPVAILDRYVGEYKAASGFTATFRREGDDAVREAGHQSGGTAPRAIRDALPGSARALLRVPARRPGKSDRCRSGAAGPAGYAEDPAGAEVSREPERVARFGERPETGAGVGRFARRFGELRETWRRRGPAQLENGDPMINRREFLGITAGAGAALALTPELLFAQPSEQSRRKAHAAGHSVFR